MVWSRSLRVFLVIVLAVALTALGLPPGPQRARAATGDAVVLGVPSLVHSTGAELSWSRFAGPSLFDRYQVQRTLAGPTPNWRVLAEIHDPDTTRWVDTTAKPESAVSYRVVVNGTDASNQVNFNGGPLPGLPLLPVAGQARLTLQPGPSEGQATYIADGSDITTIQCYAYFNHGSLAYLRIGSAANTVIHRPLLRFDLRRIPAGAEVLSAGLTLWYGSDGNSPSAPGEIDVRRVTRAWEEGRGQGACDGSGADWREARAGLAWSAPAQAPATVGGGDYDPVIWQYTKTHSSSGGSNSFDVKGLVQQWVQGTSPNLGMLLKLNNEAIPASTDNRRWFS